MKAETTGRVLAAPALLPAWAKALPAMHNDHRMITSRSAFNDQHVTYRDGKQTWERSVGQAITSWVICDGRYRVHAVKAMGRRRARIIEIEDIRSGERFHGSAQRLQRLFQALGSSTLKDNSNSIQAG